MLHTFYIGIGGFIGASARYLVSRFLNNFISSFPLGTLTVNVLGSFALGFIMYGFIYGRSISPNFRDFLTIGILGGFTTMSTFSYESFRMLELNELMLFGLNITLNILFCVISIYVGKELALLINK
jgi:CrcB protein